MYDSLHRHALRQWTDFENPAHSRVLVGGGTCGKAAGADQVLATARDHLRRLGHPAQTAEPGCLGLCYAEPVMELRRRGMPRVLYGKIGPDDVVSILDAYFGRGDLCHARALAILNGQGVDGIPAFEDLPMLHGQERVVMRNCGVIDPVSLDHYIARDGYRGLARALAGPPEEVVDAVKASGLRGRGGAGFLTGLKWDLCRKARGEPKYLVCNADEGDPGAFMDRALIEGDPHAVLEGMLIAGYAIGAGLGYVYVRAEYPLAVRRLEEAVLQARRSRLLGRSVLGSDFDFDVEVKLGAGAFVCGEETALLASLEGRRGTPRPRPPFPAHEGIGGKPTNINNVETLANVPVILRDGPQAFSRHGTEDSPGTKTFSLAGTVNHTGLVEVPFGTTLRQIVFEIGGGIPDGKALKAVQIGGPSGGCIPARLLDLPIEYRTLTDAGAIVGSGGMIVMNEDTCVVDVARYFTAFTEHESCGKCVPCRLGTRQMHQILKDITTGKGSPADLTLLREIAECMQLCSLCGLGRTAPNPVLATLRYFSDEYEQHVKERVCPSGTCTWLRRYEIRPEACTGCGACARLCPTDAISGEKGAPHTIDQNRCIGCGTCAEVCKFDAVVSE